MNQNSGNVHSGLGISTSTIGSGYYSSFGGYGGSRGMTAQSEAKEVKSLYDKNMHLNEAKGHLKTLLKDVMPVMLWGPPGIGKSSIVKQICEEWKIELEDLRLTLLNPIDLRGLPFLDKDKGMAVWLQPEFLPKNGKGILFLDEINIAPPSTQQAAYELLLDRRIGNYKLPDGWRIVAAGNREEDMAMVNTMPSPLANRMIHLTVDADINDWKIWASVNKIDPRVIGFLNFRPSCLATVPKKEEKAFPTPRSWEYVSRILKMYPNIDDASSIIEGTVGKGTAKEFIAFASMFMDLPDVDGILNGTVTIVPKKNDVLYALAGALVSKLTDKTLNNFVQYLLKLPPEFSILALRDAAKSGFKEKIVANKLYIDKWAPKFGGYL